MKRRQFIAGLGSAAVWPVVGRAQQVMPVIGFLYPSSRDLSAERLRAFRQGLSDAGFVEGRNVAIEYRWADDQYDRLPAMAADLVRRQVSVISTAGIPAVMAARAATTTIPIVFQGGFDPVAVGFVAGLSRPGGNLTGVTALSVELAPKRLELLHELVPKSTLFALLVKLVPKSTLFALLVNPANPSSETTLRTVQAASRTLGLQLQVLHASSERDLETVFATVVQQRIGALVIANEGLFVFRAKQLGALSLRHAVPTIFQYREFAAAGGLMSYGADNTEAARLVGVYTGRILKGEKPSDLPTQQATKVELILNLKTAQALGLTIPETLLATADEVIQ